MFDDDDPITTGDDGAPAGEPAEPPPAPAPQAAASVLDSPEYKALAKQNRKLARDLGTSRAAEAAARTKAEEDRQAAEAQQLAAQAQQVVEILGDEGLAEWTAIAELSEADPVEAAKRLKALMERGAQSAPPPAAAPAAAAATPPAEGTPQVPPTGAVPPRGVDGDAPLTPPPGNEIEDLVAAANTEFADMAKVVQQSTKGGRKPTMRERAGVLIKYLGADYLRQGARPKS